MNKNIIIRTVIEGLIGWVLLALVVTYAKDMTFAQALIARREAESETVLKKDAGIADRI